MITVQGITDRVLAEIERAEARHGGYNSHHEAYAVLLEEVDEYWDEVKRRQHVPGRRRDELIQVAAVAIRAAMLPDGE